MNQENFEYITEEQAEELNKLMEQFVADSNDGYDGLSEGIIRTIVRSACIDMAEKQLDNAMAFCNEINKLINEQK